MSNWVHMRIPDRQRADQSECKDAKQIHKQLEPSSSLWTSVLAVIIYSYVHEAEVGAPPVSCRGVRLSWVRAGRSMAGVLIRQRSPAGREVEARADGPDPAWKRRRKIPWRGEGQREARKFGDRGGARQKRDPPSRPTPLARCAVRALGRVRARAPPLPPCLRAGTGAWGPRIGMGQAAELVDRQRVDGRGRHGCVDGRRVDFSSGAASGGRMSWGGGRLVVRGTWWTDGVFGWGVVVLK